MEEQQNTPKVLDCHDANIRSLMDKKYTVDFYQREYVWSEKQLDDLITDLSTEFLKNWHQDDNEDSLDDYKIYFLGEVVLSIQSNSSSYIIDGQQRLTTLSLLFIYMIHHFSDAPGFSLSEAKQMVVSAYRNKNTLNLSISDRNECMMSLFENGIYEVKEEDSSSVKNIVNIYSKIGELWNKQINERNVSLFLYWIMDKVYVSKVTSFDEEFAYVIFETMNDRGSPLTEIEMLRSFLLANVTRSERDGCITKFNSILEGLKKLESFRTDASIEFFKFFLRTHYADDFSQGKDSSSDFVRIGNAFHRWTRDNKQKLGLSRPEDYINFINRIEYYSKKYAKILTLTRERKFEDNLYLIINYDYNFTLQPALIMAAIAYNDDDETVQKKIGIVSKYIAKVLTWRTWNHKMIGQSYMESSTYILAKKIRDMDVNKLEAFLNTDPIEIPSLDGIPILNQQVKHRFNVMLTLITEIVALNSKSNQHILNSEKIEVEHIWYDHIGDYPQFEGNNDAFQIERNKIGALLVLPKSPNASYQDAPYSVKVEQYFDQNILAQTLNKKMYSNHPDFEKYRQRSGLNFKSYDVFDEVAIAERTELYRSILKEHWKQPEKQQTLDTGDAIVIDEDIEEES